jgi:Helicase associated domain
MKFHSQQNKMLRRWVSAQRTMYKAFKLGQETDLDDEKIALLEAMGFRWDRYTKACRKLNTSMTESNPCDDQSDDPAPTSPAVDPPATAAGTKEANASGGGEPKAGPALMAHAFNNWEPLPHELEAVK